MIAAMRRHVGFAVCSGRLFFRRAVLPLELPIEGFVLPPPAAQFVLTTFHFRFNP